MVEFDHYIQKEHNMDATETSFNNSHGNKTDTSVVVDDVEFSWDQLLLDNDSGIRVL